MHKDKQWTDTIANSTLCNYFYVFFIVFTVWAALSLVGGIVLFSASKLSFAALLVGMFSIILSFGISATAALFLYLICERALKPSMRRHHESTESAYDRDSM
jgi:hypothetical protein